MLQRSGDICIFRNPIDIRRHTSVNAWKFRISAAVSPRNYSINKITRRISAAIITRARINLGVEIVCAKHLVGDSNLVTVQAVTKFIRYRSFHYLPKTIGCCRLIIFASYTPSSDRATICHCFVVWWQTNCSDRFPEFQWLFERENGNIVSVCDVIVLGVFNQFA